MKKQEPKQPQKQVIYACSKSGKICFLTTDMNEAIVWKKAYGATIWMAKTTEYDLLPSYFLPQE